MKKTLLFMCLMALINGCGDNNDGADSPQSEETLEILTDLPDVVWGFDFLNDGNLLLTQRSGGIFLFNLNTQQTTSVNGTPVFAAGGEGGMLDLELHPNFSANKLVYFCYTEQRNGGRGVTLARGVLNNENLTSVEQIFRSNRANNSTNHFGCRIEFEDDNKLYLSTGEQNDPSEAQDTSSHLGKILKMNSDGSSLEIWSSGHRNVQGLAMGPDGQLFATEHGPTGGDELNLIVRGSNYGWPLVTRGSPVGSLGESAEGFVDPLFSWTPSIAPSGMTFWRGDLYMANLRGQHIRRLSLNGTQVVDEEILFSEQDSRFRNLREGPDGQLYFSTDDGKIGRIR